MGGLEGRGNLVSHSVMLRVTFQRSLSSPKNGPTLASPAIASPWWELPLEAWPWDCVKVMGSTSSCQKSESYVFTAATVS